MIQTDYDVIVIGGGAAGLVAATGMAGLGARTALVEKSRLGGDCTWTGCIPSKALLKSAQVFSLTKRLEEFGIHHPKEAVYDTSRVMDHVRDVVREISSHHPPEVFERRGIKVLFGNPAFVDRRTIELDGKRISAKRFIIATGSHPLVPPIEGLQETGYLTNETIFDLQKLPVSLAVLGGGPIGVEISQAMARLGVEVTLIEMADRILLREDRDAAQILTQTLEQKGVRVRTGMRAVKFSKTKDRTAITVEDKDKKQSAITAEKVLVAVGRQANVAGLNLEKIGVKYSTRGIETDGTLQTSVPGIYACGDVTGPYPFSHMAEYQAIVALSNALFPFKRKVDYRAVAWATFTDPEVAHMGLTEEEAGSRYGSVKVYRSDYGANDRAVTDLETTGFVKIICDRKGRILGAHAVGANAGEIIHEIVLAKSAGLKVGRLSDAVHVYPTISQTVKRGADQHYFDLLSAGWFKRLSRFLVRLMR